MESGHDRFIYRFKQQWILYAMLVPGFTLLILFSYFPMFGIITAFEKYEISKGFLGSRFIGLENFQQFLSEPMFYTVIKNTLGISLLKLVIGFPIPIIFALLLNEIQSRAYKKTVQTISYLPHFISWVIVIGIWGKMLSAEDGIINSMITALGGQTINFMVEPQYMWPLAIITEVWKETGWNAIIYLAALTSINPQLYEAATVDGASRFKQMLHVTIPGIKSTIMILLILSIPNLINSNLDQMWVLGTLPVRDVTEVIDTYVLRTGIGNAQYSLAAAVGLIKTLISVILLVTVNKAAKRMGEAGIY